MTAAERSEALRAAADEIERLSQHLVLDAREFADALTFGAGHLRYSLLARAMTHNLQRLSGQLDVVEALLRPGGKAA